MASPLRVKRMALSRLKTTSGEPGWSHPNGWAIRRETRDWDMRGYRDTVGSDSPKRWYEIKAWGRSRNAPAATFARLRDARAWCDDHRYDRVSGEVVDV